MEMNINPNLSYRAAVVEELVTQRQSMLDEMKTHRQTVVDLKIETKQGLHDLKMEVSKVCQAIREGTAATVAASAKPTPPPAKVDVQVAPDKELQAGGVFSTIALGTVT